MRRHIVIAATLALVASPTLALDPVAKRPSQQLGDPGHQRMRELPADWLDGELDAPADDLASAEPRRSRTAQREEGSADEPAECKPRDGTTGAILGAVAGGLLGNVIDGGNHRALGTLAGAGGGALLGRSIEKSRGCK